MVINKRGIFVEQHWNSVSNIYLYSNYGTQKCPIKIRELISWMK